MNQSQHQFDEDSIKAMEVKDGELTELLERLAASDALFATPTTTVRDVAEATEASPQLIARILADIRSPGEVERIDHQLENHEARIRSLEKARQTAPVTVRAAPPPVTRIVHREWPGPVTTPKTPDDLAWEKYRAWLRENLREESRFGNDPVTQNARMILAIVIALFILASAFLMADAEPPPRDYPHISYPQN